MADPEVVKEEPEPEVQPPAEVKNTETPKEHMVPKSRLDEEIAKRKDGERKIAANETASKEAEEQRLKDNEEYKKLAETYQAELETLKPKAAVADEQEKILQEVVAAQIEELPEDARTLVPDVSTLKQLSWLAVNKPKLMKPTAPGLFVGVRGAEQRTVNAELTNEELQTASDYGMTPEEYANNKDKE